MSYSATLEKQETVFAPASLSSVMDLAKQYNIPPIDLDHYHPDKEAVSKVGETIIRRFMVFPLFQLKDQLFVVISNPEDYSTRDFLWHLTGLNIEPVLSSPESIERGINRYFLTKEKTAEAISEFVRESIADPGYEEVSAHISDETAPTIKLVQYIISQAIKLGASDIHLESFKDRIMLRYRVDGVLHEFPAPPLHSFQALVSRIKILSNLDIAERRLPQDGGGSFQLENRQYDLRVSIVPNVYGEGVVIRILDADTKGKDLNQLGIPSQMLGIYERMIRMPYGIILVTGPTGSGKTTTLYSTLKNIYTPSKKIITLEDPVEYKIDGITQIQMNPDIGYTFASGLRSILRHDPDVIMLGEIRDAESAEIAIRASLTGHLVLSTLHTNDALSAVTRLIDIGIPSYLILSSLLGVVAQRLVRCLCPKCKVATVPGKAVLKSIGIDDIPKGSFIYKPKGCSACGNLGYKGREGVFELLEVTQQIKQLPQNLVSQEAIRRVLMETGFASMRENALQKLFNGTTSVEEVLNVTMQI